MISANYVLNTIKLLSIATRDLSIQTRMELLIPERWNLEQMLAKLLLFTFKMLMILHRCNHYRLVAIKSQAPRHPTTLHLPINIMRSLPIVTHDSSTQMLTVLPTSKRLSLKPTPKKKRFFTSKKPTTMRSLIHAQQGVWM